MRTRDHWIFVLAAILLTLPSIVQNLEFVGIAQSDSIHRFFDSSPFSSDDSHLIYLELPQRSANLPWANVTVYDRHHRTYRVLTKTLAWAAQLGAQVQVVGHHAFFNALSFDERSCSDIHSFNAPSTCRSSARLHGMVQHLSSKKPISLPCPVYHVSSDGRFSVSVNLTSIQHTQRGYGVDWFEPPSVDLHNAGVFINHVTLRSCKMLFSLYRIASTVGINVAKVPVYGFHTKWSSDGEWIMFVMRTLETRKLSGRRDTRELRQQGAKKQGGRVRVNHMFALRSDGSDIRYLLSWASQTFIDQHNVTSTTEYEKGIRLFDGNHPNWIPGTHRISMNLAVDTPSESTMFGYVSSLFEGTRASSRKHWRVVSLDVDAIRSGLPLFYHRVRDSAPNLTEPSLQLTVLSNVAVGHPTLSPEQKYLLMDAYPKELDVLSSKFRSQQPVLSEGDCPSCVSVPLILVNLTDSGGSNLVSLLNIPVSLGSSHPFTLSRKDIDSPPFHAWHPHAWRCDAHPTWSTSGKLAAMNAIDPATGFRRIWILNMTDALAKVQKTRI